MYDKAYVDGVCLFKMNELNHFMSEQGREAKNLRGDRRTN